MNEIRIGVEGYYRLLVGKPGCAPRVDTGWFRNLITDAGENQLGTMNVLSNIHVGTGTNAPANGDTTLQTWLASHSTSVDSQTAQASAPYYGSKVVKCRFDPGEATGNISELGVANGGTSVSTLFSRARVLDGGGSPTTITVLADEYLDVYYELRYKPPTSDVAGSSTISGAVYDTVLRAANVTTASDWANNIGTTIGVAGGGNDFFLCTGDIAAVTSSPNGTSFAGVGGTNIAYSNNSLQRDMTAVFGLSAVGNCKSVLFRTKAGSFQASFTRASTANGSAATTTSTTSLATGTGSKVFTTNVAGAYQVGDVLLADSDGSADWMQGTVTAVSGTSLTVNMTSNSGTGTHADWTITVVGAINKTGSQTLTLNYHVTWARGTP